MKYQTSVIIARFQPLMEAHFELMEKALMQSEKVILLIGSARAARNIRNPLTASERRAMIEANLKSFPQMQSRVQLSEVRDHFYQDLKWVGEVKELVQKSSGPIALYGVSKKEEKSYSKWFREWALEDVGELEKTEEDSLRRAFLRNPSSIDQTKEISVETQNFLRDFAKTEAYRNLQKEQKAIDDYEAEWSKAPYPVNFVTTDALVLQNQHILLIRRKGEPAKGLWALPGGFLNRDELVIDCALRELKEESGIEVREDLLRHSLVQTQVFDHPLRSVRLRTLTHAHFFKLPGEKTAALHPSDDAAEGRWFPISELEKMEDQFAEDHYHMIQFFLQR